MSSLENKSDNKDIFTSIVRVKGNDKYRENVDGII